MIVENEDGTATRTGLPPAALDSMKQAADLQQLQIRSAALQAALATSASLGPDEVIRSARLFRDFLSGIATDVTADKPA